MENRFFQNNEMQHDAESFYEGLGVSKDELLRIRELNFFVTFKHYWLNKDAYGDNEDLYPKESTTASGCLQAILKLAKDQKEYEMILITYNEYHEVAKEVLNKYISFHSEEMDEKDRKKVQFLTKMLEMLHKGLKEAHHDENNPELSESKEIISLVDMMKKVDMVKKANYDFIKYFRLATGKSMNDPTIDNLLDGALSASDTEI